MAKGKMTEAPAPAEAAQAGVTFTKEHLAASKHFQHRRDVIRAILDDDKRYTIAEAQAEIDAFFGKKVR